MAQTKRREETKTGSTPKTAPLDKPKRTAKAVKREEDMPVRPGCRRGGSKIARRVSVARREERMVVLKGPSPLPPVLDSRRVKEGKKGKPEDRRPARRRPKMEEMLTTSVVVRKVEEKE